MVTVFGILNLTEDSFFDESRRLDPAGAVTAASISSPRSSGSEAAMTAAFSCLSVLGWCFLLTASAPAQYSWGSMATVCERSPSVTISTRTPCGW